MGLKRITGRIEVTYPANDPRTLAELSDIVRSDVTVALDQHPEGPRLGAFRVLNAAVDPDPEPELPAEPVPGDQTGSTAP